MSRAASCEIPLTSDGGIHRPDGGSKMVGLPMSPARLTSQDILALVIQILCLTAGFVTIGSAVIASKLGEIKQLVVIGVLLTIMGNTFASRFQNLLLFSHVRQGTSIQTLDAILRRDAFFDNISLPTRALLLIIYALPILLSASYKQFVGGNIVATLDISDTFKFGMVGAPGMQNLGNGLSLMENSSMPFFQDPKLNNTYSFNMFSMTNKSTCFLDGPMPSSVQRMRSKLSQGGSLEFSANVTGTMAFDVEVPEKVRNISSLGIGDEDVRYGSVKINSNTSLMGIDFSLYPARFAFLFGQYNVTDLYVSKYSPDRNQTFGGQARRIKMERRQCSGTRRVTQSTVNLLAANCDSSSKGVGQGVLNNNFLAMQQFAFQMAEFITMPPSGKNGSNPDDVDLFVPATGAAVWSRITSLNGVEDGGSENLAIAYPRKLQNVKVDNSAMKRNVLLFLILLLFPAATFGSIAVTAMVCSDTPISQNFGLLALMASSMPENREILRGASYSGKTNTVIGVDFFVQKDEHNLRQWISCAIREQRHSERLTRGKMYD